MDTDPPSTCCVRARLITDAMMGPTQGVQMRPRLRPTTTPLQKPFRFWGPTADPVRRPIREVSISKRTVSQGTSITTPNRMMSTTATMRSASTGMPSACTIAESASVKAVKLTTNPASTPNGRALPPPTPPDRTIGSTGRMQGERIVITPDRNANARRTSICGAYIRFTRARIPSTPPLFQAVSFVPLASICTKVSCTVTP